MSTVSTTVNVSGMTCGHCVSAVSEELKALAGVEKVDIDLNAGGISTVTITSSGAAVLLRNRRGSRRSRLPGGRQRGLTPPPVAPSTKHHRQAPSPSTGRTSVSTRAAAGPAPAPAAG